jgi:hypothetical protein
LLYTPCWLSKLSACVRRDHTSEREKIKKIQQKETKKKEAKKQEDSMEGALCVFSFLLCGGAL